MTNEKQDCCCPKCGDMDIAATGNVSWNVEDQCFEVQGVHGEWWCNHCESEFYNPTWFDPDRHLQTVDYS